MNIPTMSWSPEYRQLLFIEVSTVTAVALSYDYMTTEGVSDVFFLIIGAGLLLTLLVTVPVLLVNSKHSSD
jgi:hypothetical protein